MAGGPVEPSVRLALAPSAPACVQHRQPGGGSWLRSFCALIISAAACALALFSAVRTTSEGTPAIARNQLIRVSVAARKSSETAPGSQRATLPVQPTSTPSDAWCTA